jgi:hypothetical protein
LHARIAAIDSPWATQLEASYISRHALRSYDPSRAVHVHIDRGVDESLSRLRHDQGWVVQRYVVRERGTALAGPAPQTLIDPVSPNGLRQAMRAVLRDWAAPMLNDPAKKGHRGYQSYVVLSLCRILNTLEYGTVVAKPVPARWAQEALGQRWTALIDRTWVGRHNPRLKAEVEDVRETLELIRYALERGGQRLERRA